MPTAVILAFWSREAAESASDRWLDGAGAFTAAMTHL
jgi:hypothetical protein